MVRFFPLALVLASVSAFSPVLQQKSSTSLTAIAPENEIGVLAPVGFFE
jgi:hypothetical protein